MRKEGAVQDESTVIIQGTGSELTTATVGSNMASCKAALLDESNLKEWSPSSSDMVGRPEGRGILEHIYQQQFSFKEIIESKFKDPRVPSDPHHDARTTLLTVAHMIDAKKTRATISPPKNDVWKRACLILDVIKYEDVLIRALPDSGDPIVLVRVSYYDEESSDPSEALSLEKQYAMFHLTMPDSNDIRHIACHTQDEMDLLRKELKMNSEKLSPEFKAKISKGLLHIPYSYTSYVAPMHFPLPEKTPRDPCLNCNTPGKYACSKCKIARYCSKECQKEHWKSHHKKVCKPPEDLVEKGADCNWVEIDPTVELKSQIPGFQEVHLSWNLSFPMGTKHGQMYCTNPKPFEDVKEDKMMLIKVSISPGESAKDSNNMLIYNENKKVNIYCTREHFVMGPSSYERLYNMVQMHGDDKGWGQGGVKAFFNGYVTKEKKLRIFVDEVKPIQTW